MRYFLIGLFALLPFGYSFAAGSNAATPYFEIQEPFIVNLADKGSLSFLQVNAQLKVKSEKIKPMLTAHLPAIQHTVMMVLSEQTSAEIKSVDGKQNLRQKTLKEVQALLLKQIGTEGIEDIYFTSFVIQ